MDEWTRFFPSQKGEIERPEDFDNEPLHAYSEFNLGSVQLRTRWAEGEREGASSSMEGGDRVLELRSGRGKFINAAVAVADSLSFTARVSREVLDPIL